MPEDLPDLYRHLSRIMRDWEGDFETLAWSFQAISPLKPYGSHGRYFCYPVTSYPHVALYVIRGLWVVEWATIGTLTDRIVDGLRGFADRGDQSLLQVEGNVGTYECEYFHLTARRFPCTS